MDTRDDTLQSKTRDRALGRSGGRLSALAWDWAAVFLIVSAPFAKFLAVRDYGFLHLEALVAFGLLGLLALPFALLIALSADALRPIVLSLLVALVFFTEFGLPFAQLLESFFNIIMGKASEFLILLLLVGLMMWCLRTHVSKIMVAAFGVMVLSSILLPKPQVEALTIVEREQVPTTDDGPVIHLILDQQIGLAGLHDEIPGAAAMREELAALYRNAGFRVYGNAFTHFPATLESIPNLMNASVEPQAIDWIEVEKDANRLLQNQWLRHLRSKGYAIEVLQSSYIDFCSDPEAPVARCETYDQKDIRILHDLPSTAFDKARNLLFYFVAVDYWRLSRTLQIVWHSAGKALASIGIALPVWNAGELGPSTVISLGLLDRVATRLETIGPGQAYIVHLLLPHDPYALEKSCQIKPRFGDWSSRKESLWWMFVPASRERQHARYREYFKQLRCLNQRLAGLFEILEQRGLADDATMIVHGDHGSMIASLEPKASMSARLSPQDIVASYSTLFAIKAPGLTPGIDSEFASLQGLFARHAMGMSDFLDHHDIFLMANRKVIGGGQMRRPMVPLGADEAAGSP